MTRVLLVEDGLSAYPLAAIRSLARAGYDVGLAGPITDGRSARSRHVASRHVVPAPEVSLDGFADAVSAATAAGGYDVVFGGDDIEVLALATVRERIPAVVPYPAADVVRAAVDKLHLTEAARAAGLTVPRTVPGDEQELHRATYPVVVKARLHWTPGATSASGRLPARICSDEATARGRVAEIAAAGGAAVLQEPVTGDLMAMTLLLDQQGTVIARGQQRAEVVSPTFGTSVRAVTTAVDDELAECAVQMLRTLGWWGVANLQFLRPAGGGPPHLIDLNPRFYGSLALAIRAGIDLPVLWTRIALGEAVPGQADARCGVRYQLLEEDLRVARHGGGSLLGVLRAAPRSAHTTLSLSDPGPAIARAAAIVRAKATRRSGPPGGRPA